MSLLSIGLDAKTIKGEKLGVSTAIMYFAPVKEAGRGTVCPNASKGCAASCLFKAGMGRFPKVIQGRINRTIKFFDAPEMFGMELVAEIAAHAAVSQIRNMVGAVRLNGTSDIPWERFKIQGKTVMRWFPAVQFYDYTKSPKRALDYVAGKLPKNYHLTFSRSECNETDCLKVLTAGGNVAAVFAAIPETWKGFKVVNGDESDVRFLDESGVVVGLSAKGPAKKDQSGFVIQL